MTQLHRRPDQATVVRAGEFREAFSRQLRHMGFGGSLPRNYTSERFRAAVTGTAMTGTTVTGAMTAPQATPADADEAEMASISSKAPPADPASVAGAAAAAAALVDQPEIDRKSVV